MNEIKGKTSSGFEYIIPEDNFNDYELLEELVELEDNPALMPKIIKRFLGDEQLKKLKDHLRNKDGKVLTTKISSEFSEILQNTNIKK